MTRRPALAAALQASSVAIIGASDNPHKVGGRPLHYLARFGYTGPIYPINAARDRVQGRRAYPSLSALPDPADLVVVAVPADRVLEAVEASAAHGASVAVIMASGFGETGHAVDATRQQAIVEHARRAGMRIIGPNSQGLANFANGLVASFSTMFQDLDPLDGHVAVLSQSGIMSAMPVGLLRARGIGVRHAHATGNEADVTVSELALTVLDDPEVRLLLLYLESIRDAGSWTRLA
jgi:acyl-CoA synthetase (NDP forming)